MRVMTSLPAFALMLSVLIPPANGIYIVGALRPATAARWSSYQSSLATALQAHWRGPAADAHDKDSAVLMPRTLAQTADDHRPASGPIVEIRSYNLRPGRRDEFHALFVRDSLPLLRQRNIDVVAYGPSLHDRDSYFLIRAFPTMTDRDRSEDAFYKGAEWVNGPRAAVLAAIESYTTIVITVHETTLRGLRGHGQAQNAASDLDILVRLNADYIESVKTSNVRRFNELLAEDFLCTLPDGTLVDRNQFLTNTAKPFTLGNLQAHDLNVRLMGDFAIVHARTTFTLADGTPGSGRYTDVWTRRGGQWVAIVAHVSRQ